MFRIYGTLDFQKEQFELPDVVRSTTFIWCLSLPAMLEALHSYVPLSLTTRVVSFVEFLMTLPSFIQVMSGFGSPSVSHDSFA